MSKSVKFFSLFSIWAIFSILLFTSCSSRRKSLIKTSNGVRNYKLQDNSGEYLLEKSIGLQAKKNRFFVKRKLIDVSKPHRKILEKSISISTPGMLKRKLPILRPEISQYTVWFEGKKHFSQMKLNEKNKSLEVTTHSNQVKNKKEVPFPKGKGVYCFFSQLIECVKQTGFMQISSKKNTGVMNFIIIWDGYPFYSEIYPSIPNSVFSNGQLEFVKKSKHGLYRFSLTVEGQELIYELNRNFLVVKHFWVTQGLSMVLNTYVEPYKDPSEVKKRIKKRNEK
jgi:hypothetical protein